MRPIKLELEGFTSFRQPCELNFSEFDLFAITGPTGAGKSSLLDAMTYALFGCTARLGKVNAAKELLSQNALSMSVCLEFQVGHQIYKVYRGLKGKTSKGQLEKQSATGEWVPETGSIKQMDTTIQEIVGLDFKGFTRAVILPQGKFDEFLRGDADERRKVLKDLLGMQVFEKMMQLANSKAKDFNTRADLMESQIERGVTDETRKELENAISGLQGQEVVQKDWIAKFERAQSFAEKLAAHRTTRQVHRKELEAAEGECERQQTKVQELESSLQQKEKVLAQVESGITALAYDQDEHMRLTGLIPQVKRQAELKNEVSDLEKKRAQNKTALESDLGRLKQAESTLAEAVETGRREEESLSIAKESLEKMVRCYGLPQAVRDLGREIRSVAAKEDEQSRLQSQIRELQANLTGKSKILGELTAAKNQAEAAKTSAEQRLEQLQHKHRAIDLRNELRPGGPCPVCEQTVKKVPPIIAVADLEAAKRADKDAKKKVDQANNELLIAPARFEMIEQNLEHKSKDLKGLLDSISSVREKVRAVLDAELGRESLAQLEKLAVSIEQAQAEIARLEKQAKTSAKAEAECRKNADLLNAQCGNLRERLKEVSQQIQEKQKELAGFEQSLAGVPDLEVLQQQFLALDQAKKQKDHLEKRHEQAQSAVEKARQESSEASIRLEAEKQRALKASSDLEQTAKQMKKAASQLQAAVAPIELPDGREPEKLREALKTANELLRRAEADRRSAEGRLTTVSEKLKKNQELEEQCKQLKQEAALYRELGTLLSADRFQDYMLQSSYKLLAREGSRHFEELTGGRYSFHSDKDEFSVRDHSNGDELRSVSTLSGGESFLASLSLALALAQSIVELSGERGKAALESLFLDEGFSTLDSETLGKVADALPALQKKGRLIGVITHVESLADQLPARIQIEKTPTGSRIIQPEPMSKAVAT